MFLGMQDLDFAQIESNLPKFNNFCPNLINFAPKNFDRECGCIPSSYMVLDIGQS